MASVGCRIFTEVKRAEIAKVEQFRDLPVANICDNMGRIYSIHKDIRPYNSVPLLGSAITVKAPAGDNLMFHKAIAMAKPGDVIVVDGEAGVDHALCGEIMFREAIKRGIVGFLIDGCIRDVESLGRLPLSVYARGVQPKGPYKNGPGEVNVPVSIGGIAVLPGDIIVGDADGVVVIRPEDADEVYKKAKAHSDMEADKFAQIEAGTLNKSWVDKTLEQIGCNII